MRKLWPLALLLAACGAQDVGAGLDPLRLTATSLPPAYRPYSFTLDGKPPEGLSFQGGRLFGVPKEKGSFPLLLTVEDAAKNSRAQRLTLTVSDPPPPRLALVLPPAQVEGPFLLLARVEGREAVGFQMEVRLADLEPDLAGLKALSPAHLLDYDPATRLLRSAMML